MNIEKKALAGIRVLDMTQFLAGPYCGAMLADMGAEVIKIEGVKGDFVRHAPPDLKGESIYFQNMNRGKKGITLNLKAPEGKELFSALLKTADVFLENNRPGVMDRLGFPYETAAKLNPRLIYCSISGFGQTGPYKDRPGYDLIAQALGGAMSITGMPGQIPLKSGIPLGDVLGGMNGVIGILAALNYRNQSGVGQQIDTALVDGVVCSLLTNTSNYLIKQQLPRRSGNRYFNAYPYDSFTAKDGEYVIACGTDPHFYALCDVMGMPELKEDPRFKSNNDRRNDDNADQLKPIINRWSSDKTVEECIALIQRVEIPVAPIYDFAQVTSDPHISKAREMFVEVEHPVIGRFPITGNPIKMSETPTTPSKCGPLLGQHNEEIYGEIGLSPDQLKAYRAKGVV